MIFTGSKISAAYNMGFNGRITPRISKRGSAKVDQAWRDGVADKKNGKAHRYENTTARGPLDGQ